eukprot:COSAG02_NODE_1369_length_13028_cov_2.767345_5_plen_154_part_00
MSACTPTRESPCGRPCAGGSRSSGSVCGRAPGNVASAGNGGMPPRPLPGGARAIPPAPPPARTRDQQNSTNFGLEHLSRTARRASAPQDVDVVATPVRSHRTTDQWIVRTPVAICGRLAVLFTHESRYRTLWPCTYTSSATHAEHARVEGGVA